MAESQKAEEQARGSPPTRQRVLVAAAKAVQAAVASRRADEVESAVRTLAAAGAGEEHAHRRRRRRVDQRDDRRRSTRSSPSRSTPIMHHPDFQKLESAWRGLHYLVNNTETDEMLKIRVMNISKKDLAQDASQVQGRRPGTRARSSRSSTRRSTASSAASPTAAWSATTTSTTARPTSSCWARCRKIAAAIHAPFIAGASPALMQMESWQELSNPRDLTKIFTTPEYAAWRSLRESEDARYLGLAHAALPGAAALRREDQPGRGVRLRGGHRRARTATSTPGRTPPTRWRSTSTARSSCTAGARASAASSRAARSRGCRRTPSRPTTAAST